MRLGLTEVAFVECDLGLGTKRLEALDPCHRLRVSSEIVWTYGTLPWPFTQGIGEVENRLSLRHV